MSDAFELTDEQFNELMRICKLYRKQAKKCLEAKSYLASCVMEGAALEGALMAMCDCFFDEIPAEKITRLKDGHPKPILKWTLYQLVEVARECSWLPARLGLNDEWDYRKAHIGDWAVVVRQTRNLVHAGCYLTDFAGSKVGKRFAETCYEVLDVAVDHLEAKIYASIRAELKKDENKAVDSAGRDERVRRKT